MSTQTGNGLADQYRFAVRIICREPGMLCAGCLGRLGACPPDPEQGPGDHYFEDRCIGCGKIRSCCDPMAADWPEAG